MERNTVHKRTALESPQPGLNIEAQRRGELIFRKDEQSRGKYSREFKREVEANYSRVVPSVDFE
jgi:hypothetical protein